MVKSYVDVANILSVEKIPYRKQTVMSKGKEFVESIVIDTAFVFSWLNLDIKALCDKVDIVQYDDTIILKLKKK